MNIEVKLTKKRKRGRPSKEELRIFNQTHNFNIPDGSNVEEIAKIMQKQADEQNIPIKFITTA